MPKFALSYVEFHNNFFMQGTNLGNKVNAAQRGAVLLYDTDRSLVWIQFKGKLSFIPLTNIVSADVVDASAMDADLPTPKVEATPARRGRPPKTEPEAIDPNDAAAIHRAEVRARSATANVAAPTVQNDLLIQQSRSAAMGMKHPNPAQVQTPTQPTQGANVAGKPKAISHAQLKTQIAQEMKS